MVEYKGLTECIKTAAENKVETLFFKTKPFFSHREAETFEIFMDEDENSSDDETKVSS